MVQVDPKLPGATYKSGDEPRGANTEIPDELWPSHVPTQPVIKNTTCELKSNGSHLIASPDASAAGLALQAKIGIKVLFFRKN